MCVYMWSCARVWMIEYCECVCVPAWIGWICMQPLLRALLDLKKKWVTFSLSLLAFPPAIAPRFLPLVRLSPSVALVTASLFPISPHPPWLHYPSYLLSLYIYLYSTSALSVCAPYSHFLIVQNISLFRSLSYPTVLGPFSLHRTHCACIFPLCLLAPSLCLFLPLLSPCISLAHIRSRGMILWPSSFPASHDVVCDSSNTRSSITALSHTLPSPHLSFRG